MKLSEIKPLRTETVQESFIPGDIMLAIDMLATGQSQNISHKLILAQVVNYVKENKITAERFRELNEFQPSPEMIENIKKMSSAKLKTLACWAKDVLEKAIQGIDDEGYMNPQEELVAFLNKVAPDR